MAKSLYFRNWLVLAVLLVPTLTTAQEVTEGVDSIEVDPYENMIIESYYTDDGGTANDTIYLNDEANDWQKNLPQYDLKEYEWVDIFNNPKYAIVTKGGKKGIYDLILHKNITEIEYRDLGFSKQTEAEDTAYISMFYATKGIKRGMVSIYEPTNNVVSIWMNDPDELYSLDECTTIDKKITKKTTKLLEKLMQQKQMEDALMVVLDAKSGRLKAWVRLDRDTEKDEAGKLLVHSCSGSLTKPFHAVMALEKDSLSLDSVCGTMTYRSAIKTVNDDVMRPVWGDDYSICCCVSATQTGKEMQFFGARANLAKCLLYAINGGVDEKTKQQVGPAYRPITSEYLDYDEVIAKYDTMMDWLAGIYVNVLNLIQYMHDKYYYEAAEMALIDTDVRRTFATGIAGFSHVVDSLSAIKYAKVKTIRDESGLVVDYEVEGDFPKYGNDDDRADQIGVWLLKTFMGKIKKYHTYRDSEPSTSLLTITSNVVYGKATGATPDGRKAYTPFAPGGSPSYGAEQNGLLASLNSVAKIPYEFALDGISNTQTMNPSALGHNEDEQSENLVHVMDGYFDRGAHHLNVNVFGTEKLIDAMEHPEKPEYANFTIRVSGYAVKFIDLTREQQLDVISRTCHKVL